MMNARLSGPPELELPGSGQLGMFVVGQLAARHGIKVSLRPSPYGGTTAIVLMPHAIIVPREEASPAGSGGPAPRPAAQASPAQPGPAQPSPAQPRRGWREPDMTDPDPSWAAALSVGSPGRHRLDSAVPAGHPDSRAYAEPTTNGSSGLDDRTIIPTTNGLLVTDQPPTSSEPVRGPWEPPIGQEPPRVHPSWGTPTPGGTHLGLPLRVRQANLAPQLRRQSTEEATVPAPAEEPASRSPEETLSMMSAFQDGWQRGRTDALGEHDEGPTDEPGSQPEAGLAYPDAQHAHDGEDSS